MSKKRDWSGLLDALDAYAAEEDDAALYPFPLRRDGLIVTDGIKFHGKWIKLDSTKLSEHRENVGDISQLALLTELKFLDLARTAIADLSPLAKLAKLEELDLDYTRVTDLEPVRGLTRLKRFTTSDTPIRDISPLANLVDLESLWFYDTAVVDVSVLANFTKLKTLSMGFARLRHISERPPTVSDISPLADLRNLELLYLNGTQVTDLTPLAGLTRLKKIFLYEVPAPRAAIDELQRALPDTMFFV